jgi:hypothetical protein
MRFTCKSKMSQESFSFLCLNQPHPQAGRGGVKISYETHPPFKNPELLLELRYIWIVTTKIHILTSFWLQDCFASNIYHIQPHFQSLN